MIEVSSQLGQFIVEELDHMKMVKDNSRFRKMKRYGADISRRHIHSGERGGADGLQKDQGEQQKDGKELVMALPTLMYVVFHVCPASCLIPLNYD